MAGIRIYTVVLFSDAAYAGGAEKYLHLLATGMDRDRFHPVAIVCNMKTEHLLPEWLRAAGIETFEMEWKGVFSPSGMKTLYDLLKNVSPDILHINLPGPFDAMYGMAAPVAKLAGVKGVVSTEHLPMFPSFFKSRLLKGISTRFIDRVIAVSDDNRAHLVDRHRVPDGKISVIYNGVPAPPAGQSEDMFSGRAEGEDFLRLIMIGSIEERKGHSVMIEAMRRLPEEVVLTVVGEGPDRVHIEKKVQEAGIGERVAFAGFRSDVLPLMRGADLLVVPSLIEATPYVIMEAFSTGLPVVASGIFGIPELVTQGSTGKLVRAGDAEALASSIAEYHRDRVQLAGDASRCIPEFEKRFTIEKSVKDTCLLYEEIIRKRER